jgi:hypothetical protein
VTVREFWVDWTSSPLWARPSESTNVHNRERTCAFVDRFGDRPMASVGPADVAAWLVLLGDQLDDDRMVARANQGFDQRAGTGDHLDPNIPDADLKPLKAIAPAES